MKREFLQLAHIFPGSKITPAGRFVSEKLDGMRCLWDGGVSRGVAKTEVPWANNDRDERYKKTQVASGLWSRYGNVIHAPDWFLDALPKCPIDGELYMGRGEFQRLMSTVKDLDPGPEWVDVRYVALDSPPPLVVFADGNINTTNFKKQIKGALDWWTQRFKGACVSNTGFKSRYQFLGKLTQNDQFMVLPQEELPFHTTKAEDRLRTRLDEVVALGGEGLIVKSPHSLYACERSWDVLKVKPELDAEAKVRGYVWGDKPDNTRTVSGTAKGKLLGKMGALLVEFNDKTFNLSGFTDAERQLTWMVDETPADEIGMASTQHGRIVQDEIHNPTFPRGSKVTFKYRELTDDGLPKEARFHRKHD